MHHLKRKRWIKHVQRVIEQDAGGDPFSDLSDEVIDEIARAERALNRWFFVIGGIHWYHAVDACPGMRWRIGTSRDYRCTKGCCDAAHAMPDFLPRSSP